MVFKDKQTEPLHIRDIVVLDPYDKPRLRLVRGSRGDIGLGDACAYVSQSVR